MPEFKALLVLATSIIIAFSTEMYYKYIPNIFLGVFLNKKFDLKKKTLANNELPSLDY